MTSIELRLLNTCCITQKVRCWGRNNQKDTAKEQGHGKKSFKVFSLNPFYQFGEDNWNIMFKQILRCYFYVLTKEQGKGTLALPKNLPRLLITSWQRKDVWKTLFQNKSSGTINPAYLPLRTLEQHKDCVNENTLSITTHNSCLRFFLQLWRNIPVTNMTSIVFCFGRHALERNYQCYTLELGWYAIERHLLEQLLRPIHAIK